MFACLKGVNHHCGDFEAFKTISWWYQYRTHPDIHDIIPHWCTCESGDVAACLPADQDEVVFVPMIRFVVVVVVVFLGTKRPLQITLSLRPFVSLSEMTVSSLSAYCSSEHLSICCITENNALKYIFTAAKYV